MNREEGNFEGGKIIRFIRGKSICCMTVLIGYSTNIGSHHHSNRDFLKVRGQTAYSHTEDLGAGQRKFSGTLKSLLKDTTEIHSLCRGGGIPPQLSACTNG